jgi:hypothetical protein
MWNTAPSEDTGADQRRKIWSILLKRNDGADIDGSTCVLGMSLNAAGPLGADISVGGTIYQKIRSDGWYLVWTRTPEVTPQQNLYYWVALEDGITLRYESPQVEGDLGQIIVGAGASQLDIAEPTSRVITLIGDSDGRSRTTHNIVLDETYQIPPNGWMGCTIIPKSNYADQVSIGDEVGSMNVLAWEIDSSNRVRMKMSNTEDAFVFQINKSGESASQVFAQLTPADHVAGVPLGLVATWGYRRGAFYSLLCLNGSVVELDTNSPDGMPTGPGGEIAIGRGVASSTPANCNVQNVAIGARALSRHDVRVLSRWFQKDNLPVMGPNVT